MSPSLDGRGQGRVTDNVPPYHFQNTRWILKYIVVPESQHREALAVKPGIPCCIANVIGVLPAIQFDDKLLVKRHEIHNIFPYRFLPPELDPFHLFGL